MSTRNHRVQAVDGQPREVAGISSLAGPSGTNASSRCSASGRRPVAQAMKKSRAASWIPLTALLGRASKADAVVFRDILSLTVHCIRGEGRRIK